ncbi:ABC transporter ATP-binding protein [bacterium]|nr:ABC transporter ATP-binding protein [bacterium]MBU1615532.1 ABC transporter ATP-binding protein [bacterium]
MKTIIYAKDLVKVYDKEEVVKGISFGIIPGECFGFLGPNGAGKTTVIRMIYCFSPVTSGELSVLGRDVKKDERRIKALIGVVPQEDNLDPDLTVFENLIAYARYFDIPSKTARERANELLEFVGLTEKRKSLIKELSGGMKRRLMIARSLISRPELLILDEPTTGLDPGQRRLVWERLRQLKKAGVTIVLSTHYMEEASYLCDRVALMDKGEILIEGEPEDLIKQEVGSKCVELVASKPQMRETIERLKKTEAEYKAIGETLYIFSKDGRPVLPLLIDISYERLIHRKATLEDLFLKLTGRSLEE